MSLRDRARRRRWANNPGSATGARVLFSTQFTGADGALPSPWVLVNGLWVRASNQAAVSGSLTNAIAVVPVGTADVTITAQAVAIPGLSGGPWGIAARVADANNFYNVFAHQSAARWFLRKYVAGIPTDLGSSTQVPANGDLVALTVKGTSIIVRVNGTQVLTAVDASIAAEGQGHGLCTISGTGTPIWDNVVIEAA